MTDFTGAVEEIIEAAGQLTTCSRCGSLCKVAATRNLNARVLRKAATPDGLCAGCALTHFLRRTEPIAGVLDRRGPQLLLAPAVQAQIGVMLAAAGSDADLSEIDWEGVIAHWDKPLPKAGAR